jgi:hypothetical protein
MHHVWMPAHWLIALLLPVLGLTARSGLAHERREVGAYQLVVGFLTDAAADLQFPNRLPALREIQSAVRGTQQTAQQAQDAALAAQAGPTIGPSGEHVGCSWRLTSHWWKAL